MSQEITKKPILPPDPKQFFSRSFKKFYDTIPNQCEKEKNEFRSELLSFVHQNRRFNNETTKKNEELNKNVLKLTEQVGKMSKELNKLRKKMSENNETEKKRKIEDFEEDNFVFFKFSKEPELNFSEIKKNGVKSVQNDEKSIEKLTNHVKSLKSGSKKLIKILDHKFDNSNMIFNLSIPSMKESYNDCMSPSDLYKVLSCDRDEYQRVISEYNAKRLVEFTLNEIHIFTFLKDMSME